MAWKIEYLSACRRQLKRLDPQVQRKILEFMRKLVENDGDPYAEGKALTGNWSGYWRYRINDYRIICRIENQKLIVTVVRADHRSSVYD